MGQSEKDYVLIHSQAHDYSKKPQTTSRLEECLLEIL